MRLFELNKDYTLEIAPEAFGYPEFSELYKRDKTKGKSKAIKEMLFVYHSCDLRSNYLNVADEDERRTQIAEEIELPENWKPDEKVQAAMDLYIKRSKTVVGNLYESALISTNALSLFLRNSDALLKERDKSDKPLYKPKEIAGSIKMVPDLMGDLKKAEREYLLETKTSEGKSKGKQVFNTFEEGLDVPDGIQPD